MSVKCIPNLTPLSARLYESTGRAVALILASASTIALAFAFALLKCSNVKVFD